MSEPIRHTPGPWAIAPYCVGDELLEVVSEYEEIQGGQKVANWIAECDAGCDFGDDRESVLARNVANAHLIAAAPELLAALKQLSNAPSEPIDSLCWCGVSVGLGSDHAEHCVAARAAIQKAEGR